MKNLKLNTGTVLLMAIVLMCFNTSCKKDKDNDGNNSNEKQYVPSQILIRTTGSTATNFSINYTYNESRQITRMVQDAAGDVTTWDYFYLSNGNVNRMNYVNGSDNGDINFTYNSDNRLTEFQEVAGGSTTDYSVNHNSSTNTYIIGTSGSTGVELDLDANNHMEALRNTLSGDITLTYLTDQKGVFANVQLNPSVIIPFHLVGSYIYYYMQPHQITQMSTSGVGVIMFSDQARDSNGNLTSFRVNGSGIDETFTVSYELK